MLCKFDIPSADLQESVFGRPCKGQRYKIPWKNVEMPVRLHHGVATEGDPGGGLALLFPHCSGGLSPHYTGPADASQPTAGRRSALDALLQRTCCPAGHTQQCPALPCLLVMTCSRVWELPHRPRPQRQAGGQLMLPCSAWNFGWADFHSQNPRL